MKKNKILLIALISIVLFFSVSIESFATNEDEISKQVNSFRKNTKCNSVSVVIYDNGRTYSYGDQDGLYQIGSMSKAFTGLAIQKLIYEGKLSLDSKVSEYIPGFEVYYESNKVDINVSQLLQQTSGFTNSENDYPSANENMSLAQWGKSMSGKELKSAPGEKYAYSNTNYNLLGVIIENVSGMSYKEYMEQEILQPLQLKNTYIGLPGDGNKVVSGTRLGYWNTLDFYIPVREGSIPAGYLYSNTSDMCRWLKIWLEEENIPEEYTILIRNTKQYLNSKEDYFSGWECFGEDLIGHSGGTPNYSSRMVFSTNKKVGVCVLTNLNVASSTDRLCNDIYAICIGDKTQGYAADVWTIFDNVFGIATFVGIAIMLLIIKLKKRRSLIICDIILLILFLTNIIVLPIIFGASPVQIFFTWAPWSVLGCMIILAVDIIVLNIKTIGWKK